MYIYSNELTARDLERELPAGCGLEAVALSRPRIRSHGWRVRLVGSGNRYRNSGKYGAESTRAATYDQHGEWFARLFKLDRDARIGPYDGFEAFDKMTRGAYRRPA